MKIAFDFSKIWGDLFSGYLLDVSRKSRDRDDRIYREARDKISELCSLNVAKKLKTFDILAKAVGLDSQGRQEMIQMNRDNQLLAAPLKNDPIKIDLKKFDQYLENNCQTN